MLLLPACNRGGAENKVSTGVKLPAYTKTDKAPANDLIPTADELAPEEDEAGGEDTAKDTGGGDVNEDAGNSATLSADGEQLYVSSNCTFCHEPKTEKYRMGPKLKNLSEYWTVEDLVLFLSDPAGGAIGNKRLIETGREYERVMPPTRLSDEDLDILAAWLLVEFK